MFFCVYEQQKSTILDINRIPLGIKTAPALVMFAARKSASQEFPVVFRRLHREEGKKRITEDRRRHATNMHSQETRQGND